MTTILCYGDSNTNGTCPVAVPGQFSRYPRGDRWPDAMAAALGPDTHVLSEGLPGRTTVHDDVVEGGGRNGLTLLAPILASHAPLDLLILMLGTNDLKPRFGVTAYEIARSVERLVGVARATGHAPRIMVVSPAPVVETGPLALPFAGAQARQAGLAGHMAAMAARQGCGFVDAGAHVRPAPQDGVHWSAESHRAFGAIMAAEVTKFMNGEQA